MKMKNTANLRQLFSAVAVIMVAFLTMSATVVTPEADIRPNWEKLGACLVKYDAEKDVIGVSAYEGRFNAVRIKVEKSDINLYRVAIHYGNGDVQNAKVGKIIREGQTTRAIDLKGKGKRIIKKVEFWYETKGYERRKARVELWGRRF